MKYSYLRKTVLTSLLLWICMTQGCSLYLLKSGLKEIQILAGRESIDQIIGSGKSTDTVPLNKLVIVKSARLFARNMGLKVGSIYSSVTDLGKDHVVSYLLTAIKAFDLSKHATWWFPIVGTVPYKGFITKAEAEEEATKWERKGYETNIRDVEAFSTLGWFNDPVLSSFLTKSDRALAKLLFHELSHATFWSRDVVVNESLAEFISIMLIESFYPQTRTLSMSIAQNRLFRLGLIIESLFNDLDKDFRRGIFDTKAIRFDNFNRQARELGIERLFAKPNNAQLYDLYIYSKGYQTYLEKLIQLDEDPRRFITWVSNTYAR